MDTSHAWTRRTRSSTSALVAVPSRGGLGGPRERCSPPTRNPCPLQPCPSEKGTSEPCSAPHLGRRPRPLAAPPAGEEMPLPRRRRAPGLGGEWGAGPAGTGLRGGPGPSRDGGAVGGTSPDEGRRRVGARLAEEAKKQRVCGGVCVRHPRVCGGVCARHPRVCGGVGGVCIRDFLPPPWARTCPCLPC